MIKPIGERLLIRQEKKETNTSLILTTDAEDAMKLPKGNILAIGSGVPPNLFTEGDLVYFNEFAGDRVKIDEVEYLLLRLNDVLAKDVC